MNWPFIEQLWYEVFVNNLHVNIEEFCVLLGEKPVLPLSNRETMIQLTFETFKAGGFFVCEQSVLALFSSDRTTGIVLDAGEGIHHIVPVYEGYSIPHAVVKSELSGAVLTDFMRQMMVERTPTAAELPLNCLHRNFQAEGQSTETFESTKMPNGKLFEAGSERFKCPELMFDPSLNQRTCEEIHQSIFNSIMRCDIDIRKDLYKKSYSVEDRQCSKDFRRELRRRSLHWHRHQ
jgi:actin-related protein